MATNSERRESSTELLHELEAISQSLFQSNRNHRAGSLILDRSSVVGDSARLDRGSPVVGDSARLDGGSRSHRLSLSPWQSHPKKEIKNHGPFVREATEPREKKGIWSWKPLRALSHIRMQRTGCLFSVKVVGIQGLPASTNGLRLSVAVRKKETKEGAMRTTPSRVIHGSAGFDETLFVRCHLYRNGKPPVFEPRLFLISVVAVDAPELHLGASTVDLSRLVKQSVERSFEGARVREWDMNFELSGKANGGELVLKLGFQIREEGGVSIYSQAEDSMTKNQGKDLYFSSTRKESMSSFSTTSIQKPKSELKVEDLDFSKLEIVDKGVENVAERCEAEEAKSEGTVESIPASREVVKEVVHQRMMELESIAKEIKALESAMSMDGSDSINTIKRNGQQNLDADEETVTRKFLQMLEREDEEDPDKPNLKMSSEMEATTEGGDTETRALVPDLGKGLGPVVQTRDGGYLVSMNPFDMKVEREETPKLAMQISRPFILQDQKQENGLEVFQRLAAMGPEELTSKLLFLTAMDELMGKTAEQVAFEGVASAIIRGRSKEGASFSVARPITTAKMMSRAMVDGRKERTSNSIWKADEDPITMEEILAFSMQKMEAMVMEGLKVQAEMTDEDAPSDVSILTGKEKDPNHPVDSTISLEEWERTCAPSGNIKLLVAIQLRDPIRQYEPVGGLQIAVLQAMRTEIREDEEAAFKVTGIHVGGVKLSSVERQRQRLSAMQWLVGAGMGKAGRQKKKVMEAKTTKGMVWSFSSILEEDIWLKPSRNPNVKFL